MLNNTYLEQQKEKLIEHLENEPFSHRRQDEIARYFPEVVGKDIPEDGHWILIIQPPPTEYTVKKFSIWYAMNDNGKPHDRYPMFVERYAKIHTPKGDLRLHPHEYNKIDIADYIDLIDGEHVTLHYMTKDSVLEKAVAEKVYYIQTRGIAKLDAFKMVLGDIKDPNLCYLEFHQAYIDIFTR